MRYLATPNVATAWLSAPVLLAETEFTRPPVDITIVGSKQDVSAKVLLHTAFRSGSAYERLEWWDRAEGLLPHADVQYPSLPRAAAFLCTATTCSSPISDPKTLEARAAKD